MEEERKRWYFDLRGDVRSWAVSVIATGLVTAAGTFVGVAKQAWGVSPWWSGAMAFGLLLAAAGLFVFVLQGEARKGVRERRKASAASLERLVNARNAAAILLSNCPDEEHPRGFHGRWQSDLDTALETAAYLADEDADLPNDIAVRIHNPRSRPTLLADEDGMSPLEVKVGRLALIVSGLEEAATVLAEREGIRVTFQPVERM